MTKKLGILGGMGSLATAYFFKRLVENTAASIDQDHIDSLIFNYASIEDRTKSILSGDTKNLLSKLKSGIKVLTDWGAENIAIPCNTAYYFYSQLQFATTEGRIINMIKETIDYVLTQEKKPVVGLLATDGTVKAKVYEHYCQEKNVPLILPSPENQKKIMNIIYNEVKSGKSTSPDAFQAVMSELREMGATKIILACTELSAIKDSYNFLPDSVDALEVLVMRSIQSSGGSYQGTLS